MNKNPKILTRRIAIRLTEQSTADLDFLCAALGVTRSEFVRKKINNINALIMNNDIFNIKKGPETNAWGQDIEKMQNEKEATDLQVKEQVKEMLHPKNYFEVQGNFGAKKIRFSNLVEAANAEQAGEAAHRFHTLPGRVVKVESITPVDKTKVAGKQTIKA